MATPPLLVTQAQLEIAVGGPSELLQLADKSGTGSLSSDTCQSFITEVITIASGKIYSLVQVAADPSDPNVATAFVVQCAVTAAVYWAWHKSTGGIAVPPDVKEAYRDAIAEMKEYAEGLRAVGSSPTPSTSAGLETIDPDPCGQGLTRSTLNRSGFT